MKKNKFMRLASGLLVGTLLTTCAISGTFAKYTTQDSASDKARVAKWGVELQVMGTLYGNTYADTANNPILSTATEAEMSVQAFNKSDNVVAPGTKSDTGFTVKLSGTPEVDTNLIATIKTQNIFLAGNEYGVMVKVDGTVVTAENFAKLGELYTREDAVYTLATQFDAGDANNYYTLEDKVVTGQSGTKYYPVVYSWSSSGTSDANSESDVNEDTLNTIATEMAKRLNGGVAVTGADTIATDGYVTYTINKEYETNFDLSTLKMASEKLTWNWNFTDEPGTYGDAINDTTTPEDINDGADTILGNIEQGLNVVKLVSTGSYTSALTEYTDYCLDTSFDINIAVNQVD